MIITTCFELKLTRFFKMQENLPELRDIHLPDGVSIWPPAYGWWVIIGALAVIIALYEVWRFWRRKNKKLYALRLLGKVQEQNVVQSAREMSEILRRICVFKYPEAATIFGKSWIDFLNNHSKLKISGNDALLLSDAPFISIQSQTFNSQNLEAVRKFCQAWIGENL